MSYSYTILINYFILHVYISTYFKQDMVQENLSNIYYDIKNNNLLFEHRRMTPSSS